MRSHLKVAWEAKTLGDVCRLVSGQHIEAKDYNTESRGIGYLTGPSDFGLVYPVVSKWTEHPKVNAIRGDILITVKGSGVGKINLLDQEEVAISRQLMAVRVTEADPSFVYAFLSSTFDHFQAQSTGAAIPGISRDQVLGLEIAVPPLPEQRRIVGILDEAFEGIATAEANAEKNLQNARALFESHLQSVFTERGEGWEERPLAELCEVKDGTHDSPKYVADGVPFVTQKNIRREGLSLEDTKFITQLDHDDFYRRSNVAYGDILISMIGANRGMACIVDDKRVFSIKNVGLVKQNGSINQDFLLYFLKSQAAIDYVSSRSKGGAQEFIGLTELRKFPIRTTSLQRQAVIVAKLDVLSSETARLASIYQQKLAALDELKKSLLHQAFSGQL